MLMGEETRRETRVCFFLVDINSLGEKGLGPKAVLVAYLYLSDVQAGKLRSLADKPNDHMPRK